MRGKKKISGPGSPDLIFVGATPPPPPASLRTEVVRFVLQRERAHVTEMKKGIRLLVPPTACLLPNTDKPSLPGWVKNGFLSFVDPQK